jgi:hypothetical protein
MADPADDAVVAAHLAAAVIQTQPERLGNLSSGSGLNLSRVAAQIYFDCLIGLREQRAEREKAPAQN